jgi:3-oxoacyl-[acyl-carrier-protein] synthase-3
MTNDAGRTTALRTKIAGIGKGVPEKVLTNLDLEKMVDTSDEWITERTGIKERHVAAEGQVTSDMAAAAALEACRAAGVKPEELDCIVLGTVTPDMPMPATAAFVQQKIGARTIPAFDISAACAGWLFGLGVADGLIARRSFKRVLVIGVELLSRVLDWTDRNTCVLFGDAAGAAVLVPSSSEGQGILDVEMRTDGAQAVHLEIPGGGSLHPASHKTVDEKLHIVHMNGRQIFTHAVRNMSAASMTVLERCGYKPEDVTTVFAHQANMRILEGVSQRTGIGLERFFINIQRYGNTSSASIPIALSEALAEGKVKQGDLLLLTALGAGVSWASALVRW